LGKVPLGRGVDASADVPLAQPHHLEAFPHGEGSTIRVLVGLKGGGEALVELSKAGGGSGAGLRPRLFGGEGTPFRFLIEDLFLENEAALAARYLAGLHVGHELVAAALGTPSLLYKHLPSNLFGFKHSHSPLHNGYWINGEVKGKDINWLLSFSYVKHFS